jgi:mannose-6-phosphate isomerase-like protein (cupin superfamily)
MGEPIDMSNSIIDLDHEGRASVRPYVYGPPKRIDGYSFGAPYITGDPPHNGEMHPDGDELLYLIDGAVDVLLEEPNGEHVVSLGPGQALVVPKGTWHKVMLREPSRLIHLTPGPGGDHRPL